MKDWRQWMRSFDERGDKESRPDCESRSLPVELGEGHVHDGHILDAVYQLEEQEEIGTVGTRIVDGYVRMEQTTKYRPIQVRGYWGFPGDFEDFYRQEVVIRDSIDGIVEVQRAAKREVQAPDPELIPEPMQDEMSDWVDKLNGWWANIEPSADSYVTNATHSICQFGLAPFEVVWDVTPGEVPMPAKLAYREPSTIDRWVATHRNDVLLGATFQTGGDEAMRYFLPATGDRLEDTRLILARLAARGNNWEGVSPIRPAIHWIKFKQLLGQIAAASAQKYGVPTTFVRVDPGLYEYVMGSDDATMAQILTELDATQAVEAPMFALPDGYMAETVAPPGSMPNLEEMMRYCDEMIARPFSNEGSLLGHGQVGSYALASVQEDKWLRSAPAYDRAIMEPVNDLVRKMTRQKFGTLRAYPQVAMRLDTTVNTSARLDDLSKANGGQPIETWPKPMQKVALEALGMSPDALEPEEPVENAFDAGKLPSATGFVSRGQERRRKKVELAEYSDRMLYALAEFESAADGLKKFMDESENALAREWNMIAAAQRRVFRDETQGVTSAQELDRIKDEIRSSYAPEYFGAAQRAADRLRKKGAAQFMREIGLTFGKDATVPELPPELQQQLEANLLSAASEANNRNTSYMYDQRVAQITETDPRSVKKLKQGTLGSIAGKVTGRAFNAGRLALIGDARRRYQDRTGKEVAGKSSPSSVERVQRGERIIKAIRSTMLDERVCPSCEELEGVEMIFGSAEYWANHPPEPCEGGGRCRCVMIHEVPDDMVDDFDAAVNSLPAPF